VRSDDPEQLHGMTEVCRWLRMDWGSFCRAMKCGDLKTTMTYRNEMIREADLRAFLIAEIRHRKWSLPRHRDCERRGGRRTKKRPDSGESRGAGYNTGSG